MISEFNTYLETIDFDFWSCLCREKGELISLKRGEEFITVGDVAKYIGLVKEGSFKYVVYTDTGEEKILGLETIGGFCASWPYCLRGKKSIVTIIANTDSELYCYPVSKIIEMAKKDVEIRRRVEESIEEIFYTAYSRLADLYALSPTERYDKMLIECPRMFEIFPLKDIASYLNITPEHLSRIRRSKS